MADETNLDDNFGAQPEGSPVGGYVANFEGDEIDGKRYALGDRIDDGVDAGTIAYLVQNGRISAIADGAEMVPSGGESGGALHGEGGGGEETPSLTEEQQAEADKLVADNNTDELHKLADNAGVSKAGTKAEVAARIVTAGDE